MASPTFVASSISGFSGGNSTVVPKPTGTVENDVMYWWCSQNDIGEDSLPTSAGWVVVVNQDAENTTRLIVLRKVMGDSEPSTYTFNWTESQTIQIGGAITVRGADNTTPEAATPNMATGDNATPDPPASGTVASGDYLAIAFFGIQGKRGPNSPPTNYTERHDRYTTGGGPATSHVGMGTATRELTGITSENPGTFGTNQGDAWVAGMILIAEDSGEIALAGAGDAAADGSAAFTVEVLIAGGGDAASDGSAALDVSAALSGSGDAASDGSAALDVSGQIVLSGAGDAASEGSGDLTLDPAALAGSGNAASDGSGAFTVEVPLSGAGDAASEGSGDLGTPVSLSGSGNAASDGSGDMGDFSFMLGSGDAASEGSGALIFTISITLSVTLPVMQFTGLLDYILNPGLVGGVIRPSSAAYAPFSVVGGTATGSPGGQQGGYIPVLADPSLYQPLVMWRKHSLVAGDDPPRAVLVPYTVIPEE